MVNFDPLFFGQAASPEEEALRTLNAVWESLVEGGKVLMPLDKYPFSERYGWIQDKYGLSWQLMIGKPDGDPRPTILPCLTFMGGNNGRAKAAIDLYLSVFRNSKQGLFVPYGPGQPNREGAVMFADFQLEGQWLAAMDGAGEHGFAFNEAVSLLVRCDTQAFLSMKKFDLKALQTAYDEALVH